MSSDNEENYNVAVDEAVIEIFRENALFYDKTSEQYLTEYRNREQVLTCMAGDIKKTFPDIEMTGDTLFRTWSGFVTKFKDEFKKSNKYTPSGSQSLTGYTSPWPYYEQMMWYAKFIAHVPQLTSDPKETEDYEQNSKKHQEKFGKTKRVTRASLSKLRENSASVLQSVSDRIHEEIKIKSPVDNYMGAFKNGWKSIPIEKQFPCYSAMIVKISEYARQSKKDVQEEDTE